MNERMNRPNTTQKIYDHSLFALGKRVVLLLQTLTESSINSAVQQNRTTFGTCLTCFSF